jgi:hypothetical protein
LLAVYNNSIFASDTMKRIGEKFVMKNLGGVKCYTGIDVENRDGKFFISQCRYIDQIVEEAKLKDAKDSKFPVDTGYYKQQGKLLNSNEVYRKLIGMLLYLSTQTRPDIAASVAILSKRVQDPRDNDLVEVRRVIRYLKGSRNLKLKLNDCHDIENVFAFSDANWAEDPTDRKSNTGYLVSANGGAASWCCRKQDCIAQSSCESEYVALNETCKEIVYLIGVCNGLDLKINLPVIIKTDSQSCISMIANEKFSQRNKHIDLKYLYIRDQVAKGIVKLEYVPTDINVADLMTKPLGSVKLSSLRRLAGLEEQPSTSTFESTDNVEEECCDK